MREYLISSKEEGRRLDKFIMRILAGSPSSFAYKMLRKKNIVLNDKKASGNEILCEGDCVRFYLSDETFDKFSKADNGFSDIAKLMPDIVYEDDDFLFVNKPSGMLSQKSSAADISLNEICLAYVRNSSLKRCADVSFTCGICNRLDRNTSGIVTFAKTYRAAKILSAAFSKHLLGKYYICIAKGKPEDKVLEGHISKNTDNNRVTISSDKDAGAYIRTIIRNERSNGTLSLVEINIITGKTHQIRAHMASDGHPILGDYKYGDRSFNDIYKKKYGITDQMLVCYKLVIPDDPAFGNISGRTFEIELPEIFKKVF